MFTKNIILYLTKQLVCISLPVNENITHLYVIKILLDFQKKSIQTGGFSNSEKSFKTLESFLINGKGTQTL